MALRNEFEAAPVGRAWGVPPDGRPAGGVTPWFSRHWRNDEVPPLAELDGVGAALVVPQPAAATATASATGASRRTDAGRLVDLRNGPVKVDSLDSDGPVPAAPCWLAQGPGRPGWPAVMESSAKAL